MSVRSGKLPSAGFVAFCVTLVLVVLFFVWGLATPPLDRVWQLHHLLKIGEIGLLHDADRDLLEDEMAEHGELARDLMDGRELDIVSAHHDGWIAGAEATLLRTPESSAVRQLEIDVQAPEDLLPLRVVVRAESWEREHDVVDSGLTRVALPPPGNEPEVIEIEVKKARHSADTARLDIRVTWEGAS